MERSPETFFFACLVIVAGMVLALALYFRYQRRTLEHQERLAVLEKGGQFPPFPEPAKAWTPRIYLLRGLVWLFTGISIVLLFGGLSLTTTHERSAEDRVRAATEAKRFGASDEQAKAVLEDRGHNGMPFAMALIGLIPAGVGLAYLITYRVETKVSHVSV
jgi:uncharacterized protein HemX